MGIFMGLCELCQYKNIIYTTKLVQDLDSNISFYFSTEPLTKLDASFLLFLSHEYTLQNNIFVKELKNNLGNRIINLFEGVYKEKKYVEGEVIFCTQHIPDLEFHKIAVICLPETKFQDFDENRVKQQLRDNFKRIALKGAETIAVTEPMWMNWENKKNSFTYLYEVLREEKMFKSVIFACLGEDSLGNYISIMRKEMAELRVK